MQDAHKETSFTQPPKAYTVLCWATNSWYSCRKDNAPRRIISGRVWKFSKHNLFRAFQIAHALADQRSISSFGSLSTILRVKARKSEAWAALFWVLPLTRVHTFRARGHSHKMWHTVSIGWWHIAHQGSTCNFFLCRLSRVGRILEHALHKKFLTLGGVLSFHTDFQNLPITPAIEWFPNVGFKSLCATPYADLTVNLFDLFSLHISTSLAAVLVKGTRRISSHVCLSNQKDNLVLSHCPVSTSTNSETFFGQGPFLLKHGGRGSQLWVAMSTDEPLPTFHIDPSRITSQACSKLLHKYHGLLPRSASKNDTLGKYLALYTLKNREFCWCISRQRW